MAINITFRETSVFFTGHQDFFDHPPHFFEQPDFQPVPVNLNLDADYTLLQHQQHIDHNQEEASILVTAAPTPVTQAPAAVIAAPTPVTQAPVVVTAAPTPATQALTVSGSACSSTSQ